jgi:hypothetical protein
MFNDLKERIHAIRIPIKNKRVLMLVQFMYFSTPIVLGTMIMQYVVPDPDEFRKKLNPSDKAVALSEHQRRGLQTTLDAAKPASIQSAP